MNSIYSFGKGDRVMTTDYKVFAIVDGFPDFGTVRALVKKTKAPLKHTKGYYYNFDPKRLLKCKPYWTKMMWVLVGLLAACLAAPASMPGWWPGWLIYGAACALIFGGRAYQYYVQWR